MWRMFGTLVKYVKMVSVSNEGYAVDWHLFPSIQQTNAKLHWLVSKVSIYLSAKFKHLYLK